MIALCFENNLHNMLIKLLNSIKDTSVSLQVSFVAINSGAKISNKNLLHFNLVKIGICFSTL